ncbi:putative minor capsid protein [Ligilactobacillus acidipiscis]|uniref:putative minor capsid protein n=1 Tax=Ligilactobacillus acidipiscis TaxID=89059 RepID=UPI0023F66ACE|nr:putative minor capsid protein [Ligilactobacillus acidipiscis]WEV56133.1 putative minor capsid protein [Ligilactobacillus acidipiscis]
MIPKFPKSMANQSVVLKRYKGRTGLYDKPTYDDPITLEHCVFQPQTIYSGTNNERQIVANAIVFLYAGVTDPIPKLDKSNYGSKIEFEGQEYALQTIVDNRDPFSNEVWSYELEVL